MSSMPPRSTGRLRVRRARAGETMLALDGETYTLDESMVVIADERGVESIAGIMGGEQSGCDETTTDVLIESRFGTRSTSRETGRKLGIVTDARYRFERGVDPAFCLPGARARDPTGPGHLRRRGVGAASLAGRHPRHRPVDRFPLERGRAPDRPRPPGRRDAPPS